MGIWKGPSISFILVIATTIKSHPINNYNSNYAPAHEYNLEDYSFSYGVKDMHTGDMKTQWEKKEGDVVTGLYSVVEADGSIRTVEYTADQANGFNAVVKYDQPSSKHPAIHKAQPIKANFESYQHGGEQMYQLKEFSPISSTFMYDKRKHPQVNTIQKQPETNEKSLGYNGAETAVVKYINIPVKYPGYYNNNVAPTNPSSKLPIDLHLVVGGEKLIAVDVRQINPVEINLTNETALQNHQTDIFRPSLQLVRQEYKSNNENVDTGFKTVATNSQQSPNTFKSGKRPITTPGLSHYNTQTGPRINTKSPRIKTRSPSGINSGTGFTTTKEIGGSNHATTRKAGVNRSQPIFANNGFLMYKEVRYENEEDK